jgi:hypothetical protein
MAIVITDQGGASALSGLTISRTLPNNIPAGASICVAGISGQASASLGDDVGNTYQLLNSGSGAYLWVCHNCIAINAGQKITWTRTSSASALALAVGSVTGGPFITDANPALVGGTGASPSVSSGPLTSTNEAVFGCVYTGTTGTSDTFNQPSGGGWAIPFDSIVAANNSVSVRGGSIVVSSANSVTYNPTITSRTFTIMLVSFKPAAVAYQRVYNLNSPESVSERGNANKIFNSVSGQHVFGANFVTKTVTGKLSIEESQQLKAGKSINKVIII